MNELYKLVLVKFLFVTVVIGQLKKGDSCQLSNGKAGICQLAKSCPESLDAASKGIAPKLCGFGGLTQELVVCCEVKPQQSPTSVRPTTIISTSKTQHNGNLSRGDDCHLSNGKQGVCKLALECSEVLDAASKGIAPKLCKSGGLFEELVVCCNPKTQPSQTTLVQSPAIISTPKTPQNKIIVRRGDNCQLKNGKPGVCKFTAECPEAVDAITKGIAPQLCGIDRLIEVVVCCEVKTQPSPTTLTQIPAIMSTPKTPQHQEIISPSVDCQLNNGKAGVCKLVSRCPEAIDDIKQGIFPQRCKSEGRQVVVCCELKSQPSTTALERITL